MQTPIIKETPKSSKETQPQIVHEEKAEIRKTESEEKDTPESEEKSFSLSDITLGESYHGYIKLQFNYGLFVTVK
jgi:hypothetical protein